jgi:hypothetical protein
MKEGKNKYMKMHHTDLVYNIPGIFPPYISIPS